MGANASSLAFAGSERPGAPLGLGLRTVGSDAMSEVFANTRTQLAPGGRVLIVVNDSKKLYPRILDAARLELEDRVTRHVNRRTGRRAGEYFEDVLICRPV